MANLPPDWKEQRLVLRELREEDFDAVVALQLRCFPKMKPWSPEQFHSQVTTFPEGQLGIFSDGRLVASSASLIVNDADYSDWANWFEMSDHGFIRNHDPEGDSLYGIEIMVDPEMRGMKLARRLYEARKELCRRKDLARIIVGGRIPGYAARKDEMTAREYVERVLDKSLFDPVLTVQIANGFQMRELVKDYLPSDEDSAGWATCLEWPNLDHTTLRSHRTRRSIAPVRVSAVQFQMRRVASFDEFAKQCEFFVDVASDAKSDFVLFPELFTLQLLSVLPPSRPGTAARTLAEMTPRYLELFRGLAVRYDVNVIGGSQFIVEDGHLYNASYLFRRDGSLDRQLKLHVTPNEARWWGVRGGEKLEVFETDRGRISIQICYDVEFPELSRIAAHRGAQLLFVPYNTNDRIGFLRVLRCAQARCIENQVYAITAGCVGNLPSVENADTHYSACGIYTPSDVSFARDGIAAETSPNIETVVTQDLDTELLRRARRSGTVRNWGDRRTDLYRVRWKAGDTVEEV